MGFTFGLEHITGVMVQYYKSCHRELWFYAHGINMNREDENILIGKQIQETAYPRERKNITIGPVSFDFVKQDRNLVVYEVKKSRKLSEPALYQLYYYLWFLKQMGVEAEGCIVYPTKRRRRSLKLTKRKEAEIEAILSHIKQIISRPRPPLPRSKDTVRDAVTMNSAMCDQHSTYAVIYSRHSPLKV